MIKLFLKFSIGSWLSAAISLFTTPVVTALIIPEEFGKASMYTLLFNLVLQVCILGTDQSFVRKFYQQSSDEYKTKLLFNSVIIPLGLSVVISTLLILFGNQVSRLLIDEVNIQLVLLMALSLVLGVFERFSLLNLRMKQQALAFSIVRVLFAVINFVVILTYCQFISKDFLALIYGNLSALLICSAVAIIKSHENWKIKKIDKPLLRSVIMYGFPFLPTFLASWLFEGIDKVSLRRYTSFEELGLFSAAFKIVAFLSILQVAFSTFWTPVSFEMYEKNSEKAKQTFSLIFAYMSAILFICGLGVILFKDVIILLFDKAYHEASAIMPFLLLIPIMYTLSEVTVGGINYKNKTYWHFIIAVIAAVLNYVLNTLLVPKLGARGAAISTGLSYAAFFYCRTSISVRLYPIDIRFIKIHCSVLIFFIVSFVSTFYPSHTLAYLIAVASIIGVAFLYKHELTFFLASLRQKVSLKSLQLQK